MEHIKVVLSVIIMLVPFSGCSAHDDTLVMVEAKFIASNAIKVSICVLRQEHALFEIDNFILTNEYEGVIQYHSSSARHIPRPGQFCKSKILWFATSSRQFSANLTLEAYIVLANSSHIPRVAVVNLVREAHLPPVVEKIDIYRVGYESFHQSVAGPHINSTIPAPLVFISAQEPNDVNADVYKVYCQAKGYPVPSVSWYKDGIHVADGAYYNISDVGYYRCEVHNQYGTSHSHTIHFKEAYFGNFVIIKIPKEVTVKNGEGVMLTCETRPSCFPKCQLIWIESADPEMRRRKKLVNIDNIRKFLTEEGNLIILNTKASDKMNYRCAVREMTEFGEHKFGTINMLNVIQGDMSLSPGEPLRPLYKSKSVHMAVKGEDYNMYCIFTGSRYAVVTWYKDGNKLRKKSPMLRIENITKAHAARYECQASNGEEESARYSIILRVDSPPSINNGLGLKSVVAVKGSDLTISCDIAGVPVPRAELLYNKSESNAITNYKLSNNQLHITKATTQNIGIVSCNATNIIGYTYSSAFINITDPTIIHSNFSDVYLEAKHIDVTCEAETDINTVLELSWYKEGKIITTNRKLGIFVNKSRLEIHAKKNERNYYGLYECVATNGISTAKKGFHVFPKSVVAKEVMDKSTLHFTQDPLFVVIVSVALGTLLVLIVVVIAMCYRSKRKEPMIPRSRLSTFSDASSFPASHHSEALTDHLEAAAMIYANRSNLDPFERCSDPMQRVSDPKLRLTVGEVFIERDRIEMNELIGKGQFGRVYLALLHNEKRTEKWKVAVKTLKYKADESDIVDYFLEEAIIMKNFTHPHVLSLTGISFEEDGSPMVVLPYMSNGDLRNYIQDPNKDITVLELLKLGLQVAQGMSYLSARKYVHRDLACRNCMVDDKNTVKVADFGLSRNLFSRDYYREACGKRPLPVRWMAPECHKSNMFTTYSDVWSFGILLWELMTRGAVPYPNIENWNVSAHVVAGNKLPQPNYCPTSVYKIMLSCWEDAEQRPPFLQIVHDIEDVVHTANMNSEESESFYINIHRTEEPDYRLNNNNTTVV